MEIIYHWEGDYQIPDLKLSDTTEYHIGKYGRMRQRFLKENHGGIYSSMLLSETLWIASTKEEARHTLLVLSESVARRLRASGQVAEMISVEIKYNTFKKVSHQTTLQTPTSGSDTIYHTACGLLDELWDGTPIRLLGVRSSKLSSEAEPVQLNLFDLPAADGGKTPSRSHLSGQKEAQLEKALDSIRQKYGADAIVRGSLLHPKSD